MPSTPMTRASAKLPFTLSMAECFQTTPCLRLFRYTKTRSKIGWRVALIGHGFVVPAGEQFAAVRLDLLRFY
jgi:hypothetical protein